MLIKEGEVTVVVNHIDGIGTKTLETAWDDDQRIGEICHELNFGKTTTLRAILDIYHRSFPDHEILLAAPTGKASRRMSEQTGF